MGKNKKVKIALKKVSDGSLIAQGTLKLNKFASDPRTFTEVQLESGRGGCAVKVALDLIFSDPNIHDRVCNFEHKYNFDF
jgi:hypothetical protein